MNDDFIRTFLIEDPEKIFDSPYISYKSRGINSIIERFDLAANPREVYRIVKDLLRATSSFRHATVPDGMFQELRTATKQDDELKHIFMIMMNALSQAESKLPTLDDKDKKILNSAIKFCKESIKERMASLNPADRLVPFWNASDLKIEVEK